MFVSRSEGEEPSPRARGTYGAPALEVPFRRTILACAGNMRSSPVRRATCGDHPRVRGEHMPGPAPYRRRRGPSPRARGTSNLQIEDLPDPGTIPACAGNSHGDGGAGVTCGDHPRVRGEHPDGDPGVIVRSGPSPRARGTLLSIFCRFTPARSIPACAGNTMGRVIAVLISTDHPRVRGEHTSRPGTLPVSNQD